MTVWQRASWLWAVALTIAGLPAAANSASIDDLALGPECEPSGMMARIEVAMWPEDFWASQVVALDAEIEQQTLLLRGLAIDLRTLQATASLQMQSAANDADLAGRDRQAAVDWRKAEILSDRAFYLEMLDGSRDRLEWARRCRAVISPPIDPANPFADLIESGALRPVDPAAPPTAD